METFAERSVVDRMESLLAVWEAGNDGRAVFLDCYLHMTRAVHGRLGGDGFCDPAWVARLLDRFADYYFMSLDGGEENREIPAPWILAHAAAVGYDATGLQLLVAGVNAHINYDLVLALVDTLDHEWPALDAHGRELRQRDYDEINAVIADTVDLVQDRVVERRAPVLELFDRALGRWDERLAVRMLVRWRTRVWRRAVTVLEMNDPDDRRRELAALERQCERRALWLLT